jgi:iron-sulfur cluster insertion protein
VEKQMLTITESATSRIREVLIEQNEPAAKLRVFVQGGGCSGMSYGFAMDDESSEDDFVITSEDIHLLIDSVSMQYLQGSVIDYKEDVMGSNFSISNPNAQTTCGCGSSFNPY